MSLTAKAADEFMEATDRRIGDLMKAAMPEVKEIDRLLRLSAWCGMWERELRRAADRRIRKLNGGDPELDDALDGD